MNYYFCVLFTLFVMFSCTSEQSINQDILPETVLEQYPNYLEKSLTQRRFKHQDILPLLENLNAPLAVKPIGMSVENRSIHLVSFGSGKTNVLLWSQMHGDEPTATMALFDLFNFLQKSDDHDDIRRLLSDQLTIHFIPMLNPDGAERYQRRNAQGIDMNRDALRLQTPEGRLLKHIRDSLEADWGFNLHDQGRGVSVGQYPASISFLAPAFDQERSMSAKRADAMKVIAVMNQAIQPLIPERVGRYWDDFEPRAFGDNVQKWGTRTILIEAGGLENDREKQGLRRANFMAMLQGLLTIARADYTDISVEAYDAIPVNKRMYHDVIIRNMRMKNDTLDYTIDLGIRFDEVENDAKDSIYLKATVSDLGDLSTSFSYKEFDAAGFEVTFGQLYQEEFPHVEAFQSLDLDKILRDGYTNFSVAQVGGELWEDYMMEILLVSKHSHKLPQVGANPSLLFRKDEVLHFALINGRIIDLRRPVRTQATELMNY